MRVANAAFSRAVSAWPSRGGDLLLESRRGRAGRLEIVLGGATLGDGFRHLLARRGLGHREFFHAAGCLFALAQQLAVAVDRELETLGAHLVDEYLIALGAAGLDLQRTHQPLLLGDDVGDAQQIGLHALEPPQRLLATGLVLRDSRGLLEHGTSLCVAVAQDLVDLALLHDRHAAPAAAGVHEQIADVLQAAAVLVEEVLALAVAIETPCDLDLGPVDVDRALAVVEDERDIGHAQRAAALRAAEDHVRHLASAQGGRTLLTHHPLDRVHDVGLPATVGADDAGQPLGERELGLVSERLEAV